MTGGNSSPLRNSSRIRAVEALHERVLLWAAACSMNAVEQTSTTLDQPMYVATHGMPITGGVQPL